MKLCIIYIIRNNVNRKLYVGQTWRNTTLRFNLHCNPSSECPKIRNAIQKYGKNNFWIEAIASCRTQEEADETEIAVIKQYDSIRNGYNLTEGGRGGLMTEEGKMKLSLALKGKPKPFGFGAHLSKINKGKIPSSQTIKASLLARLGKPAHNK